MLLSPIIHSFEKGVVVEVEIRMQRRYTPCVFDLLLFLIKLLLLIIIIKKKGGKDVGIWKPLFTKPIIDLIELQ